jgi:hypothetical protein
MLGRKAPQHTFSKILKYMTTQPQTNNQPCNETTKEVILCPHCLRTATNGIKCQGICVADSNY